MNIKKAILTCIPVFGLFSPRVGQAQGMVYSSNVGDTSTNSFAIAKNSWIAQEFVWEGDTVNGVTLTPDCILNYVQLQMDTASGNPGGFTVSIYAVGPSGPTTSLGALTGNSNPDNPGLYTYTTPGIILTPSTAYFLVVNSATSSVQGAYNWSVTTSLNHIASGLTIDGVISFLLIEDIYGNSADGSSWNLHVRGDIAQMEIFGTPVPEPSPWLLLVCGAALLHYLGRRWKSASHLET